MEIMIFLFKNAFYYYLLKGTSSNDTLVAVNTPSTLTLILNNVLHWKRTLWRNGWHHVWDRKIQSECGISNCITEQEVLKQQKGHAKNTQEAALKGCIRAKFGIIKAKRIKTVTDYNILKKSQNPCIQRGYLK